MVKNINIEKSLLALLNMERVCIFNQTDRNNTLDSPIFHDTSETLLAHQIEFLNQAKQEVAEEDENLINKQIKYTMERLLKLSLVRRSDQADSPCLVQDDRKHGQSGVAYVLTATGFDAAIKSREHINNERRFDQQTNLHKRSVWISSIALILSTVVIGLSLYRLHLATEQLEMARSEFERKWSANQVTKNTTLVKK